MNLANISLANCISFFGLPPKTVINPHPRVSSFSAETLIIYHFAAAAFRYNYSEEDEKS